MLTYRAWVKRVHEPPSRGSRQDTPSPHSCHVHRFGIMHSLHGTLFKRRWVESLRVWRHLSSPRLRSLREGRASGVLQGKCGVVAAVTSASASIDWHAYGGGGVRPRRGHPRPVHASTRLMSDLHLTIGSLIAGATPRITLGTRET